MSDSRMQLVPMVIEQSAYGSCQTHSGDSGVSPKRSYQSRRAATMRWSVHVPGRDLRARGRYRGRSPTGGT